MAITLDGTNGITTETGTGDVSVGDDLIFTGTGNRITGDFSNATHANRVAFQTSTTNGATTPFFIPNGTGNQASVVVANASDPTNSSYGQLAVIGTTDVRVLSGQLGTGTSLPMTFYTANSERMRIDTSGKVLVGRTTQQSGSYTITGGVYCEGLVSNYGIGSHSGIGGAYQANAINFQWNGSATRLWIDTTDTGSITVSSDYRIKRNIATQEQPALDRITQLRPVTYQRADYGNLFVADDVLREGFIAHELAEVIPSAVEGEKDAENQIQSLRLDALCSVMVKAIQEQQTIIESLQARIEALENNNV